MDVCEFEYNYYVPPQFSTVARASSMISDAIVIIVTWYYTYTRHRSVFRLDCQASLAALLIQDGTLYFVIFLIMNIARIIVVCTHVRVITVLAVLLCPDLSMIFQIIDIVPEFMITLSTVLICRFFLDVRTVAICMADPSSSDLRILSSTPHASHECGSPIDCEPTYQSGPQRSVSLRYLSGMDEEMDLAHEHNGDGLEIEEELRFCETQPDMSRCA